MARTTGKKRGHLLNSGNNFNYGTGSGGSYSTTDGKLMSGTKAGYGQFGQTDTEIGETNPKTGKQRTYTSYQTDEQKNKPRVKQPLTTHSGKHIGNKKELSKNSELKRVKGKELTNRQKIRLEKGGAKAERQEARIRNRAERKANREARRNARNA